MDGFIEGPAGELDWIIPPQQYEERNAENFLSCFDTILFGRKTYERMCVIKPAGNGLSAAEKEFLYMMHGIRKYVFSRTAKHVAGNAMVISGNIREEVLRIREEKGKDIWFFGGTDLLKTFMALDLIDDYLISVQPVLLKSGKPLFPGNKRPLNLKLVTRRNLKSGVIIFHYQTESRLNIHNYEGRSFEDKRFTC